MSKGYVRLSTMELARVLQHAHGLIPLVEAGTEIPVTVPSSLLADLYNELNDRFVIYDLPEEQVERALRFAELTGSSQMARTLANEVRRCHVLLEQREAPNVADLEELQTLRSEARRFAKALGESEARLAASRSSRAIAEKRIKYFEECIESATSWLERAMPGPARTSGAATRTATEAWMARRFPLTNAAVIAVHEYVESTETPNACGLCSWPERSHVHYQRVLGDAIGVGGGGGGVNSSSGNAYPAGAGGSSTTELEFPAPPSETDFAEIGRKHAEALNASAADILPNAVADVMATAFADEREALAEESIEKQQLANEIAAEEEAMAAPLEEVEAEDAHYERLREAERQGVSISMAAEEAREQRDHRDHMQALIDNEEHNDGPF